MRRRPRRRPGAVRRRWVPVVAALLVAAPLVVGLLASPGLVPGERAAAQQTAWKLHPVTYGGGGTVHELADLAGGDVRSVWVEVDGRFVGYVVGAPAFANRAFLAAFPGGRLPEGQRLILVRPATATPLPAVLDARSAGKSGADVRVLAYSSRVPPGDYASITVETSPGVLCTARYWAPGADAARALPAEHADETGAAFWTWRISDAIAQGTARVEVTCDGHTVTREIAIRS